MNKSQEVVAVVCQGWFDSDPRHGYWASSLRATGWRVIEVEVVDEPAGFRNLASVEPRGDRVTVRVSHSTVRINDAIPADSLTGRFIRLSEGIAHQGIAMVKMMGLTPRLVVANDLLIGRSALDEWPESEMIYDAHESFIASFDVLNTQPMSHAEREFWIRAEREVMRQSMLTLTVSPGLATYQEVITGEKSLSLPNFCPLNEQRVSILNQVGPVQFVFIGRHDPHRGLENLVSSWNFNPSVATLDLYLPLGPGRRKLERLAKSCRGEIQFKEAVSPVEIISTIASYDVGVIPYEYPYPYSESSPNKFGEYLSAGVAILANRQGFTGALIDQFALGELFNWKSHDSYVSAVQKLSERDYLAEKRLNVRRAFENELNWDYVVRPVVVRIEESLSGIRRENKMAPFGVHALTESFGLAVSIRSWVSHQIIRVLRQIPFLRSVIVAVHSLIMR